jgi:hypothetical protein
MKKKIKGGKGKGRGGGKNRSAIGFLWFRQAGKHKGTYICESRTQRVPFAFEGGYRLCSYRRARLQIRAPKVLSTSTSTGTRRLAALSAFPCFGHHLMQRVQILLYVVFLEQFIRVVLVLF